MLNYINSFSCTVNANKSEFILSFRQLRPVITSDGSNNGTAEEIVSEIVMNLEVATALKDALETSVSSGPLVD